MSRKTMLVVGAFLLLVCIKFALAQDENIDIQWDPQTYDDPLDCVLSLMMAAPVLGAVFGAIRVLSLRWVRPVLEPLRLR